MSATQPGSDSLEADRAHTLSDCSVQVVIVSYNSAGHIIGLLSALKQIGAQRVLVWDNASADGTPHLVREKFPDYTLVRSERNLGFAAAVNQAVARCEPADVLLLLNPDCRLARRTWDSCISLLDRQPAIGAVAPAMVLPTGTRGIAGGSWPSLHKEAIATLRLDRLVPACGRRTAARLLHGLGIAPGLRTTLLTATAEVPVTVSWVSGYCMFIRAECWERTNGLDERFFLYFEDVAFCRQLSRAGWSVVLDGSSTAFHDESSSARHSSKSEHYRRAKWQYFAEYGRPHQRAVARIYSWLMK
jgi:GT2 family glycosyltransferase